jgi:RNA polymerase sigma-70 factor (ECF subfamily)
MANAPTTAPHPDAELVARCRRGEDGAWAELVEKYSRRLCHRLPLHVRPVRSRGDRQDCFLGLENLTSTTLEASLAWIAALSGTSASTTSEASPRETSAVSDDAVSTMLPGTDDPEGDSVKRQRLRLLLDAIAELPDELAQVVMLRDLDGLDYKDIAAFLSLPDGTVKSRLNRGRIELARLVRDRVGARHTGMPSSTGSLYSPQTGVAR